MILIDGYYYPDQERFSMHQHPKMLKSEPDRGGFQSLLRGPVDVNVSEKHV